MKKTTKKAPKQYINKNPLEQLWSIGSGVTSQVADTGKSVINLDNWDEYLGLSDPKEKQKKLYASGDLSEGKVLELRKIHQEDQEEAKREAESKKHIEPGIDYSREIVHVGEKAATQETREIDAQLREIMTEIKKLADSSKELQMQFKDVAIEQHVVKPGKYHKNFFEWLFLVIKTARQQVEDSSAWLNVAKRKNAKKGFWDMAKKHGTSFLQSGERTTIANAAG